jgi:hypothetical protein
MEDVKLYVFHSGGPDLPGRDAFIRPRRSSASKQRMFLQIEHRRCKHEALVENTVKLVLSPGLESPCMQGDS